MKIYLDKYAASLLLALILSGCGGNSSSSSDAALDLAGSKQGFSVGLADYDGDGIDDKIVGAPYARGTSGGTGAALVYKGTTTGFSTIPTGVLFGEDNLGYSFVNLDDVDGDGTLDFAVGAIHGDGADVSLSGSVTVYRGGSSGAVITKLSGEWPLDKFGLSLAAGDLNSDGHVDLIVGAPFNTNDPAFYQGGAVYVFFGPSFANRTALYADSANKGLGWAVAGGDINGDGHADLLVASNRLVSGTTVYAVRVFYGAPPGSDFSPSLAAPDATITSTAAGFGKSLSVIGNRDGNPGAEIAIGAPNAALTLAGVTSRDVGSVYLVTTSSGTFIDLTAGTPTGSLLARLDGEALFNRFGASLMTAGEDLAVGAPLADVGWNTLSGKVYLFKRAAIEALSPWTDSSLFSGLVKDQWYGMSLAFGSHALVIGAPRSNSDTGGVAMVDPASGLSVPGGSSGGSTGGSGECH